MLIVLTKKECEELGAYKSKHTNRTIKVNSDVELCAASVSTKRPPERWIKVHSNSGEDDGKTFTYEKATEYDRSVLKTSFYGGVLYIYFVEASIKPSQLHKINLIMSTFLFSG